MASFLCFTSCSEDDEDFPLAYTIWCNTDIGGYSNEVRIFEYNEYGDKIYNRKITDIKKGKKYSFTAATKDVAKVKIYISVESVYNSYNKWVQRVYYLNKNKENNIYLESSTVLGPNEP